MPGLGGYAAYVKDVVKPGCASGDYNKSLCFGTQTRLSGPTPHLPRSASTCIQEAHKWEIYTVKRWWGHVF